MASRRHLEAPAPASSVLGSAPPPGGDTSFDTNVVVILAALFFALLLAIGLNSVARCALRFGGRGGGGEGASSASASGARRRRGIKRRVLRSMPVDVYEGGDDDDVCPICLGEFVDGEKVRVLPRCGHGFHVRCVDAWLVCHGTCPTCRRPVVDGGAPEKKGGGAGARRPDESDVIAVVIVA